MSIQDVRPSSQDTSNFYLANIYQTLADPNRSNTSTSLPPSPPPFTPPNHAIWVNSLWFLSLVISITCALLATLLQQWARRYLKVTQPRYSLHKRARIRAFFYEGIGKALLPWTVEALPALLHVSVFLFLAGLVVFLRNVDLTIFKVVLSWVGICTALYGCISVIPIFRHDSPYYTPLLLLAWHIVTGILYITFRFLRWLTADSPSCFSVFDRCDDLKTYYHDLFVHGMEKRAEKTAQKSPSEIDSGALMWTLDSLDEDQELERFFSGLPDFRSSKVVGDPLPTLAEEQKDNLLKALIGFLERTFSLDLLTESARCRRITIFRKSFDPVYFSTPASVFILDFLLSRCQYGGPIVAEIAKCMAGWANPWDDDNNLAVRAAVCSFIARVRERDDSWFILASKELGLTEPVLRDYAARGDSLSLVVLNHIIRQEFSHFDHPSWPTVAISELLGGASKFNAQDTSPELRHEFCSLWNQIVLEVQTLQYDIAMWKVFDICPDPILCLH